MPTPPGDSTEPAGSHGSLEILAPAKGSTAAERFAGPDHPMRKVTRQVAFDRIWTAERAAKVGALFDGMASEWSERHVDDTKAAPIRDAIERGHVPLDTNWLEVGSGTGAGTRVVHGLVDRLIACDLSMQMLTNAPALAPRVRADASQLPFGDDSFGVVLMVNMLLFPAEVDRVLAPGGTVVWVNTLGDQTPIHLPADDVVRALPGSWTGRTARAGTGFWTALRRG